MESKLTTLAKKSLQENFQARSHDSMTWFKNKVKNMRNGPAIATGIVNERERIKSIVGIGQMYFFEYQPKTADTLPYYDVFPLVLVLNKFIDGFLGINFHYLPIMTRAAYLDQLVDYASYNREHEIIRLRVSYEILNASKAYKPLQPALKSYLRSHMGCAPRKVDPLEWEAAIFLPVENFKGAPKRLVHKQSLYSIKQRT